MQTRKHALMTLIMYYNRMSSRKLTAAKKMVTCRFYLDPLRKVHSICLKSLTRMISLGIKISENIEITSWLVSAYDFYSRVVKDR